jgi:hypothetical protein
MNHIQVVLFSSTILLAAVIAVIKFKNIDRSFYPFLMLTWVASLNEIISLVVSMLGYSTTLNNNIYILAEALLILWQFKEWNLFCSYRNSYRLINSILILVWILEDYNITALGKLTMHFRLLYSLLIVIMSIHLNTRLVFIYKKNLVTSPVFLICSGFTVFFTYKILIEVFWMYGLKSSVNFRNNVYIILIWINGLINILYSVALLCIPAKPRYIELS